MPHDSASQTRYSAYFFGAFHVLRDDSPLGSGSPGLATARTVLKWFLLHPNIRFEASELADLLCDDSANPTARSRLNRAIHYLRRYLEPTSRAHPSRFIRRINKTYIFDPDGSWQVDLWDLDAAIETAHAASMRGDLETELAILESLAHHGEMTFMPADLYNDTFAEVRAAYEGICHSAQERILKLYIDSGRLAQALQTGLEILDREPYDECAAWAVAMAHAAGGDRISALRALRTFRHRLQHEMAARPGIGLIELEERLQNDSDRLEEPGS